MELDERVMAFVSEEMEIKRGKLSLESRLVEDLGIDGDDAVELFEEFARVFSVDLAELNLHWDRHFLPEGMAGGLGWLVVLGTATVVGSGVSTLVRAVPFWAGTAVALVFFGWIYTRYFVDTERFKTEPVTVREMVEAARAGKWVNPVE